MGNCCCSCYEDTGPGEVKGFAAEPNHKEPSVKLTWDPPDADVSLYLLKFRRAAGHGPTAQQPMEPRQLGGDATSYVLRGPFDFHPMFQYVFEIQAVCFGRYRTLEGPVSTASAFIDWHCRLPDCVQSRVCKSARRASYYDFCGKVHARMFGQHYCLYGICVEPKSQENNFCEQHYQLALRSGFVVYLELDPNSVEFNKLRSNFVKNWAKEKGTCPAVKFIAEIVHPRVRHSFNDYVSRLPSKYRKVEQYYHGTVLHCKLKDFFELCNSRECGVCGITRYNFMKEQIDGCRWQRFGDGFYLAPNSFKSHDYTSAANGCRAMFVCDVAPGRKEELRHSKPGLQRPSEGFHSVYGRSKLLHLWGDLNYDEIVLYEPDAVCPRYIILY